MKLPRSISGKDLIKALARLGYEVSRQKGSHIRLTNKKPGQHHITDPNHSSIRVGTLSAIVSDVATHLRMEREELIVQLFGRN
ncbi:type II toxin-antitoxin system HicA family toxin [bacterium]|nr:type II toxin-antitoxin system HicA family toxin [bacterium]